MSDKPQKSKARKGLNEARALEKAGQKPAAYEAFLRLGAFDEAARVLAELGHFAHASRLLLSRLPVGPRNVGSLPKALRKSALHAAIYADQALQTDLAVELFLALGKREQAARSLERVGKLREAKRIRAGAGLESVSAKISELLSREQATATDTTEQDLQAMQDHIYAGRPAEAMLLAKQMGRVEIVAELFAEAGMPFQAAKCFRELGETERSLDYFVRVPSRDEQYRKAVVEAVHLASEMGETSIQLEQFLTDFIATGPRDDRELEALYILGRLYSDNDFVENAEEVFETILKHDPAYRDVEARLTELRQQGGARHPELESVLKEDVTFWETDARQDLRRGVMKTAEQQGEPSLNASSGRTLPFVVGPHGTVVLPTGVGGAGFEVGATIANRYRIDELVGRGGMATVFRAKDLELGEDVALKVFSQPIDDEAALARFRQELKLSRLLIHPNIVRLYDIGVHLGFRYITMELLLGRVLEKLLGKPLDLHAGITYLLQACAALQVAHENGIVHRDLKPSNLFITRENCLKVMDFGIAKHQTATGLTSVGMLAGTPEYMSPEQINDFSTVTGATDLYALGVVAYEMFTGRRPFEHPGLGALLHMHLRRSPKPPRRHNPDLPEKLEQIILRLLAKKPEQRYSDCRELAAELERVREQLPPTDDSTS